MDGSGSGSEGDDIGAKVRKVRLRSQVVKRHVEVSGNTVKWLECLLGLSVWYAHHLKAVRVGSLATCKLKGERSVEHRETQQKSLKTNHERVCVVHASGPSLSSNQLPYS